MLGPLPTPSDVRIFRLTLTVISLLDYSKGFGHFGHTISLCAERKVDWRRRSGRVFQAVGIMRIHLRGLRLLHRDLRNEQATQSLVVGNLPP